MIRNGQQQFGIQKNHWLITSLIQISAICFILNGLLSPCHWNLKRFWMMKGVLLIIQIMKNYMIIITMMIIWIQVTITKQKWMPPKNGIIQMDWFSESNSKGLFQFSCGKFICQAYFFVSHQHCLFTYPLKLSQDVWASALLHS